MVDGILIKRTPIALAFALALFASLARAQTEPFIVSDIRVEGLQRTEGKESETALYQNIINRIEPELGIYSSYRLA